MLVLSSVCPKWTCLVSYRRHDRVDYVDRKVHICQHISFVHLIQWIRLKTNKRTRSSSTGKFYFDIYRVSVRAAQQVAVVWQWIHLVEVNSSSPGRSCRRFVRWRSSYDNNIRTCTTIDRHVSIDLFPTSKIRCSSSWPSSDARIFSNDGKRSRSTWTLSALFLIELIILEWRTDSTISSKRIDVVHEIFSYRLNADHLSMICWLQRKHSSSVIKQRSKSPRWS
jgi:hypothetical protein